MSWSNREVERVVAFDLAAKARDSYQIAEVLSVSVHERLAGSDVVYFGAQSEIEGTDPNVIL